MVALYVFSSEYAKNQRNVHVKWMNYIVYKLYLNKAIEESYHYLPIRKTKWGTSLAVQSLGLCLLKQGVWV